MRYEGSMQVMGFVQIVVDEEGISLEEAKRKAESNPEKYKCMFVESLVFEGWETDLSKTEGDESDDNETGEEEE